MLNTYTNITLLDIQSLEYEGNSVLLEDTHIYNKKELDSPLDPYESRPVISGFIADRTGKGLLANEDLNSIYGFSSNNFTLDRYSHHDFPVIEVTTNSQPMSTFLSAISPIFQNYRNIPLNLLLLFFNKVFKETKIQFTVCLRTSNHNEYEFNFIPKEESSNLNIEAIHTTVSDNDVTFASVKGEEVNILARMYAPEPTRNVDGPILSIMYLNLSLAKEASNAIASYLEDNYRDTYYIGYHTGSEVDPKTKEYLANRLSRNALVYTDNSSIKVTPTGTSQIYIVDYSRLEVSDDKVTVFYSLDDILKALSNKESYLQTGLIILFHSAPDYAKDVLIDYVKKIGAENSVKFA